MQNQKSLKSKNIRRSSSPSKSISKNQLSSTSQELSDSNVTTKDKAQSSSASIISNQTIDAMINSLKQYNQKINFKSNNLKTRSQSSTNSNQNFNSRDKSQKLVKSPTNISKNKVHFTNSNSNDITPESSEMDSLADLLFNNMLSASSSSNNSASSSAAIALSKSSNVINQAQDSLKNNHSSEFSSVTNSDILSEFTSAEDSLNHSASSTTSEQALNTAKAAILSGMNSSLKFNMINEEKKHQNHYQHEDNHRVIKHIQNHPHQGLHGYQKTMNTHYSRHIILILIIVTICCSFVGIIGYAATLV